MERRDFIGWVVALPVVGGALGRLAAYAGPKKAQIRRVGVVTDDDVVTGWDFDCSNGASGIRYPPDGPPTIGGYTVDELRIITHNDFEASLNRAMDRVDEVMRKDGRWAEP